MLFVIMTIITIIMHIHPENTHVLQLCARSPETLSNRPPFCPPAQHPISLTILDEFGDHVGHRDFTVSHRRWRVSIIG